MFAKKMFFVLTAAIGVLILWQFAPDLGDSIVSAQQSQSNAASSNAAPSPTPTDVSPETREKAIALLKSVARETTQFTAAPNRIRGQVCAGSLLWEHDEPAARQLFQNALSELQARLSEAAAAGQTEDAEAKTSNPETYTNRYSLSQLRSEFLLALAERDPAAALTALQSLRISTNGEDYDPLKSDELELQLAAAVVKKDPQHGYELAAKNLKEGITYSTMTALTEIYKSKPEVGAKFARDIFARFKSSQFQPAYNYNANANVAAASNSNTESASNAPIELNLLAQFVQNVTTLNKQAANDKNKKSSALTDTEMRELTDFTVQTFIKRRDTDVYSVAAALPAIKKYSPAGAQTIKQRVKADQIQYFEAAGETNGDYEERETKTIDELLADAAKMPAGSERNGRYSEIVNKALEADNLEKATEVAAKISEKTARGYALDQIKEQTTNIKARRGDIAEVRKLLASQKTTDEKATALTELIIAVSKNGDKTAAARLLDEANQLLPSRLKHKTNLETTIRIGGAAAVLQPERAFGIIENGIAQANEIIAAGTLINDFYEYGALDNDELLFDTIEQQGLEHTPNSVGLIKSLAAADFDRTVALADKFARPEIRIVVRYKIAQSLLDPTAEASDKVLREQAHGDAE